jgi:putative ABC transport system substrate-binding protein
MKVFFRTATRKKNFLEPPYVIPFQTSIQRMKRIRFRISIWLLSLGIASCAGGDKQTPSVGFVDAFEDSTLKQARDGFLAALRDEGFSEDQQTIRLIYRNAEGNIPTLTQIVKYMISRRVTLMATCPSLSTITAVQNTQSIPIFMMVSPTPALMKVEDARGRPPANLFGVAEDLAYIDTSFALIPQLLDAGERKLRVGLIYNQSEAQSVDAYERLQELARRFDVELAALPVNATADVQLVTGSLLNRKIDAFFANPDNTIFGAFETIIKACEQAQVPVFTSEAGLVARGAVAAYGADIYQWGYQAGRQAAQCLRQGGDARELSWEMVQTRKRVYNPRAASRFGLRPPPDFEPVE